MNSSDILGKNLAPSADSFNETEFLAYSKHEIVVNCVKQMILLLDLTQVKCPSAKEMLVS